jgi:hypothetical protein
MKRVCLFALLVLAAPAQAAEVDMNTQTCQDWLDATEDEQDLMSAWLRGYGAGRTSNGLYDVNGSRADSSRLKSYCQKHPSNGLLTASGQGKR